jgi:hypothetical protein
MSLLPERSVFPSLSGGTAMPGIGLPMHLSYKIARKAGCAQAERGKKMRRKIKSGNRKNS